MSANELSIELPQAIVSPETLAAAAPLLAFASERLAELEAQRDALALSLIFDDNPILGSFEFTRRADRSIQLGGESPQGEPLFVPMECRAPLSEVSNEESYAESDLEVWIASLSERSLRRIQTPCFYQDPTLPTDHAMIKQALGRAAFESVLQGLAPQGPKATPEAGEIETLKAPIRLTLADPDSICLLLPEQATLINRLQERVEALETQRCVFELAVFFERQPQLGYISVPSDKSPASKGAPDAFGLSEPLRRWALGLPQSERARLSGKGISRPPATEDLVSGLMRQCLAPAEFARWQSAALSAAAPAPAAPARGAMRV